MKSDPEHSGNRNMGAGDYLSRPYARRLTPDPSGGYVATIQEFPGLVAEGDSADEALRNLESAAAAWIETSIESGRTIPDPVELGGYSGKIALRIPRGLHKRAAEMASAEGTSLNQWLSTAIAFYLGSVEGFEAAIDRVLLQIPVTKTASNHFSININGPNFFQPSSGIAHIWAYSPMTNPVQPNSLLQFSTLALSQGDHRG